MLLRRFVEHVRDQNWLAVALDLGVVILGVFIGFQVDRWYDSARERAEEREYLERLLADVELSIANSTDSVAFVRRHTGRATLVLDSLRTCALAEDQRDEFASGLFQLGKLQPTRFHLGTIEEMRSSGRLGVIRNARVRDAMNGLVSAYEYERPLFPMFEGRMNLQLAKLDDRVVFLLDEWTRGVDDITWDEISIDFEALCRDEAFHGAVSSARNLDYVNIDLSERALAVMRDAKAALEAELGIAD